MKTDLRKTKAQLIEELNLLREEQRRFNSPLKTPNGSPFSSTDNVFVDLLTNLTVGLMTLDCRANINFVNRKLAELLEDEPDNIVGRHINDLLGHREAGSTPQFGYVCEGGMDKALLEVRLRTANMSFVWAEVELSPWQDPDGNPLGAVALISDLTEQRRAEEALQVANNRLEKWVEDRTEDLMVANMALQKEVEERRNKENELRISENRFRDLYENAPLAYLTLDINGNVQMANKRALEMLSWDLGDLMGKAFFDNLGISTAAREKLTEINKRVFAGKSVRDHELEIRKADTQALWISLNVQPIYDESGIICGIRVMLLDITRRKKAEDGLLKSQQGLEKRVVERTAKLLKSNVELKSQIRERQEAEHRLRQSEMRYRRLFNGSYDAIFVYQASINNAIGALIEVNDVACQTLELSRDELLAFAPMDMVAESLRQQYTQDIESLMDAQNYLFETELVSRSGKLIPVEINAQTLELDGNTTIFCVARNITKRKIDEERIRDQAALLDKAQDAIIVQDLNQHIIYWNQSAARLYKWSAEAAMGQEVLDRIFDVDKATFRKAARAVVEYGEWMGEMEQCDRDGERIIAESRWTLVRNKDGEPRSILMVNTNISERKKLETQFLRAQRMESIGTLAGGIAHDLNNVLTPILISTQFLLERPQDKKARRMLESIVSNVSRGANMIKQVLTFVRGVEGERVTIQPRHLITEICRITLETFPKSIEIHTDIARDLKTVCGDSTQLHQVLLNLCVNARDAMPNGGQLVISAANITLDEAQARQYIDARPGEFICITVRDSGIGIPPELLSKIFDPFFTTKAVGKGTGLGLSTVMAIVKSHGGFVHVNTIVDQYTEFQVFLAVGVAEEVDCPLPEISGARASGDGELVLLVDDEASIREIAKETLEAYGYKVIVACNGAEAVAVYAQNESEIDVVLVDMMMPVMDGPATISALQTIQPDIKIIAASGIARTADANNKDENGIHTFLTKPFTTDNLLRALNSVIHQPVRE